MNTHVQPVLEVVASVFLLHNPVKNYKNDKHVPLFCLLVLTQYSRAIQLGLLAFQAEKRLSPRQVGAYNLHLVGQKKHGCIAALEYWVLTSLM